MTSAVSLFATYLVIPILMMGVFLIYYSIHKRYNIFSYRDVLYKKWKLVFFILLLSIVIAGVGALGYFSMVFPSALYLAIFIIQLLIGYFSFLIYGRCFKDKDDKTEDLIIEIFVYSLALLLGSFLFMHVFNYFSPIAYNYILYLMPIPVVIPIAFRISYFNLISIPVPIAYAWVIPPVKNDIWFDDRTDKVAVLTIEVFKKVIDYAPIRIKVKAPLKLLFEEWIPRVIQDYNQLHSRNPIECSSHDQEDEKFKWLFYVKPTFFKDLRIIELNKSIEDNRLSDKVIIVAKRVVEQEEID